MHTDPCIALLFCCIWFLKMQERLEMALSEADLTKARSIKLSLQDFQQLFEVWLCTLCAFCKSNCLDIYIDACSCAVFMLPDICTPSCCRPSSGMAYMQKNQALYQWIWMVICSTSYNISGVGEWVGGPTALLSFSVFDLSLLPCLVCIFVLVLSFFFTSSNVEYIPFL